MTNQIELNSRLEKIYETITSEKFLSQTGLGNEIPFYIFDYQSKYELQIRNYINTLFKKMNKKNSDIRIIQIDLYDLLINILQDMGDTILDFYIKKEQEMGSEYIRTYITPSIDDFNTKISELSKDKDIILLTGIGKIYPLIRSHTILNNLHHSIPNKNVILFFPGNYTGSELKLFSLLKDDNYYRAFKLIK